MEKEDLKVGDKVLLKNKRGKHWNDEGKMDHYIGKIVTIKSLDSYFTIEEDDGENTPSYWAFSYEDIERKITEFIKNDIVFGDILTLRDSYRYVIADGQMWGEDRGYNKAGCTLDVWYNDDLTHDEGDIDQDIMKVERSGQIIYERQDAREMTIKEISEKLGYEVKIVKEK